MYINNPVAAAAERPVIQAIGIVLNAWEDAACTMPASMSLFQVAASSPLPGWSVAPANNNTYLGGLQFAAVAGPNTFFGQGKTYAVDITLTLAVPGAYYLTIDRAGSALIDNIGADYMTTDEIWYPSGFQTTGKAKWGFGNWGGGKWQRYDAGVGGYVGQSANPLMIVPEPSSLTLLAASCATVLRRRREAGGRRRHQEIGG
jgi:hypothetical protein